MERYDMKNSKKILAALGLCALLAGCGAGDAAEGGEADSLSTESGRGHSEGEPAGSDEVDMAETKYSKIVVDESVTYQTMESFGTSGAWWSQ